LIPELSLQLAAEILADGGRVVGRIPMADLIRLAIDLGR
jgi:hypothetical protein